MKEEIFLNMYNFDFFYTFYCNLIMGKDLTILCYDDKDRLINYDYDYRSIQPHDTPALSRYLDCTFFRDIYTMQELEKVIAEYTPLDAYEDEAYLLTIAKDALEESGCRYVSITYH